MSFALHRVFFSNQANLTNLCPVAKAVRGRVSQGILSICSSGTGRYAGSHRKTVKLSRQGNSSKRIAFGDHKGKNAENTMGKLKMCGIE